MSLSYDLHIKEEHMGIEGIHPAQVAGDAVGVPIRWQDKILFAAVDCTGRLYRFRIDAILETWLKELAVYRRSSPSQYPTRRTYQPKSGIIRLTWADLSVESGKAEYAPVLGKPPTWVFPGDLSTEAAEAVQAAGRKAWGEEEPAGTLPKDWPTGGPDADLSPRHITGEQVRELLVQWAGSRGKNLSEDNVGRVESAANEWLAEDDGIGLSNVARVFALADEIYWEEEDAVRRTLRNALLNWSASKGKTLNPKQVDQAIEEFRVLHPNHHAWGPHWMTRLHELADEIYARSKSTAESGTLRCQLSTTVLSEAEYEEAK